MRPAESVRTHSGLLMPVAGPPSVAVGKTLPLAPGAYVVTVLLPALATSRSPAASNVIATGPLSAVFPPAMLLEGAMFPVVPAGQMRMPSAPLELKHAPQFAAYRLVPVLSSARPLTPVRPVLAPMMVRIGATFPVAAAA